MSYQSIPLKLCLLFIVAVLAGCGGGGSGSGGSQTRLQGTAATGAPITSGVVTAKCQNGTGFTNTITTDNDGQWTGYIEKNALPCVLQVAWGTPEQTLHSYATDPGVVNITPLTDLAIAVETAQSPKDWFDNYTNASLDTTAAATTLLTQFATSGFSVPSTGSIFTTAFTANHSGWDALLDQLANAISADTSIVDYADLVDLVSTGSLASLPAAPTTYSITGSVTGATGTVKWKTWAANSVQHYAGSNGNGAVTFTNPSGFIDAATYQIAITASPAGQECIIANNSGVIAAANVSNVVITCTTLVAPQNYSVSGVVTGATSQLSWELQIAGAFYNEGVKVNDGNLTFTQAAGVVSGSQYEVRVNTPPTGQTCSIANGSGTLTANVTNVVITCTTTVINPTTYSISGTITGTTDNIIWEVWVGGFINNDGGNGNGSVIFTMPAGIVSGSQYEVRINRAPTGQTCSVANGSGTLTANVSNVAISCLTIPEPGDAPLYDFSGLYLQPVVPIGMVPVAPTQTPINPSSQIAGLFNQLGQAQTAEIFAPTPANTTITVNNNLYQYYYRATQTTPDNSWLRVMDFGFGADNKANTADDTLFAYTVYPHGYNGVQYSFTHPGADNIWFTSDDVPGTHVTGKAIYFPTNTSVLEFKDASEGALLIITCLAGGNDGKLFTADDTVCSAGYQLVVLDGEDHRGQVIYYDNAGTDGLWFTADDRVKNYTLVNYNAQGVSVGSVVYNGKGIDGQWFTADDNVLQHTLTLLDANYKPTYTATYNMAGNDSTWFTSDDWISAWTYYGYDTEGNSVIVANHTNKGNDGIWFTADDTASALVSLKNDAGLEMLAFMLTGMGADGRWLTGDEPSAYFSYTYKQFDDDGREIGRADMQGKGADNKWFTADDVPSLYNYWMREYNNNGKIVKTINLDVTRSPLSPVFSNNHISQYTVYNPADLSMSVSLNASDFGADGLAFTTDDKAPYAYYAPVANGYNLFDQPGLDATWFTNDDISAGYVRSEYSGHRKILEEKFDANNVKQSYNEAVSITSNTYRWNRYVKNGSGQFELSNYSIITEDVNGYSLWEKEYQWVDDSWVISYVYYNEHDTNGNIIRQGWGYTSGVDAVWGTLDDINNFEVLSYTADNKKATSSDQRIGADKIWGTSDDTLTLSYIYVLEQSVNTLAQNIGQKPMACDNAIQTMGDIGIVVRDQNGAVLPGVIAQLNDGGATVTTDVNGVATFTGITGTQDVHLFKDGYGWESFYCVAPGDEVVVQGKLSSLTVAPVSSLVRLSISPGNEYVMARLLDTNGRSIATQYTGYSGSYGTSYGDLHFNLPVGSEVTGELWVFKMNSSGKMLDAVSMGEQTYTTVDSNSSVRSTIATAFSATPPVSIAVASRGVVAAPPSINSVPLTIDMDGILSLSILYDSGLGLTAAVVPDVELPLRAQPTAISVTTETWQAWYPDIYPQIGDGAFEAAFQTGFLYSPLIATQKSSGANPLIQWKTARDNRANFSTLNTLELFYAASIGWISKWTIHTPAGQESVVLPTPPAGINDAVLPNSYYRMRLSVQAIPGVSYHDAVADQDLHNLDKTLATEVFTVGGSFGGTIELKR